MKIIYVLLSCAVLMPLIVCAQTPIGRQQAPPAAGSASPAGAAPDRAQQTPEKFETWTDPAQATFEGATYKTFHSATVGTDVCYLVYLPPNYEKDATKRYPVLYALHGGMSTPAISGVRVVPRLDRAMLAGRIPPMIIVMPNALGGKSMYCDSRDGRFPVESVIIKDLLPHVDATYRTIASREGRALDGFSMGGFGAAHLAFKYPDIFGVVSIQAPALLQPDVPALAGPFSRHFKFAMGSDMEYFLANEPFSLVSKNADKLRDRMFIRIVCHGGTPWLETQCEKLHDLLVKHSIAHQFAYLPNVKGHWVGKLADALGDEGDAFYGSGFTWLQNEAIVEKPVRRAQPSEQP